MLQIQDESKYTERDLRLRCAMLEQRCKQLERDLAQARALAPATPKAAPKRDALATGETVIKVGYSHRLLVAVSGATRVQVQTAHGSYITLGQFATEQEGLLFANKLRGGPGGVRHREWGGK